MATSQRMIKNLYRDSVSLMQFSEKLRALDGIKQASAVMATENNISLLVEAGLLGTVVPPSPNDLLIVVEGGDESVSERRVGSGGGDAQDKNQQSTQAKAASDVCRRAASRWDWNPCQPRISSSYPHPGNMPQPKRARRCNWACM